MTFSTQNGVLQTTNGVFSSRTTGVIDDFEWGGPVSQRYNTDGSGSADINSTAAIASGSSFGLEQQANQTTISHPDSHGDHDRYPEDGVWNEYHFQPQNTNDNEQYWVYLCFGPNADPGSVSAMGDSYRIEVHSSSQLRLSKNGSSITSESYNFTTQTYTIRFLLDSSAGFIAELYEEGSNNAEIFLEANDTEYISEQNSFGWRCPGNGHVYWDNLIQD